MLVSFIVPVYNTQDYLEECLDSLIGQTCADYEVIVINDGSTDNSAEIIARYASQYDSIRVITQENSGLSVARNVGIHQAKGDYIFFVDSDDYVNVDAVRFIKRNISISDVPADVITFSRYILFGGVSELESLAIDREWLSQSTETIFLKMLESAKFQASVSQKIFSRKLIKEHQLEFIPGIRYEDLYFSIKAFLLSKNIGTIEEGLYYYRRTNNQSITNTISPNDADVVVTLDRLYKFMVESGFEYMINLPIWKIFICKWVCNATFFKYPHLNFWNRVGWHNCCVIKKDPLFRDSLKVTARMAPQKNLRIAARLIDTSVTMFYIVRKISKVLLKNKRF